MPQTPMHTKRLTVKQGTVLAFMLAGYKRREIAAEMGISLLAVDSLVQYLKIKLGADTKREMLEKVQQFSSDPR